MDKRVQLQKLLEDLLGSKNVYFQPPSSVRMKYPAIVYSRSNLSHIYANNVPYLPLDEYELIVIDSNPDSEILPRIQALKHCAHSRHYTSDGLNHDVFELYF